MINVFQPTVGPDELAAVQRVFESSWLGRGKEVAAFESELAAHLRVDDGLVLTTNSCTEGMFQILELIGKPGSNVVMPSISFVGAANAVLSAGMDIRFCDVDRVTGNPRLHDVAAAVDENTCAVLVQHLGGAPCDIEKIAAWCAARSIVLIEDSAGSIATIVNGRTCGTFGDFGVWSFDAMKMVVAGDGGAIYCRDPQVAAELRQRTYMGLTDVSGSQKAESGDRWWEFDVHMPGRRSIMNDVTAAIARVQLERLPANIAHRRRVDAHYRTQLAGLAEKVGTAPPADPSTLLSHYFFWIRVDPSERDALATYLRDGGVYTTYRYYPLHRVPLYKHSLGALPETDDFAESVLMLPQHAAISDDDVATVTHLIHSFFGSLGHV